MKIGVSLKIDVTKLDRCRFFKGEKGTYVDLTTFIDTDEPDQYGNNGFVTQSPTKEERERKEKLPIVGNVKVFYGATKDVDGYPKNSQQKNPTSEPAGDFDDDLPF